MEAVLNELELDALREVATICSGHAATALAQLTERRTMIGVPDVKLTPPDSLAGTRGVSDPVVAAVLMQMLGDLTGRTLVMLPEQDAKVLCDLLLRRSAGTTTALQEIERSGLEEVGSILGSAYMDALSEFLGVMILPSVPSLTIDRASAVVRSACGDLGGIANGTLCIETSFSVADGGHGACGYLVFFPSPASLRVILDAIRLV